MKQIFFFITIISLIINFNNLNAQTVEFSYDLTSVLPDSGIDNGGVIFVNNQFWVSEWNSSDIHVLDNTGNYKETFQIEGVSNIRSMTTNGTSVYCGTATKNIYEVDPTSRLLTSTISITTTSDALARACAYDASLNNNLGGFWIANYTTSIASVDMNGNELSVIPRAVHGLSSMYSAAVDDLGNLYVHNKAGGGRDVISIIDLSSGNQIGEHYDVAFNVCTPLGITGCTAGGFFFSEELVSDKKIALGISQDGKAEGITRDILFAIDFEIFVNTNEQTLNNTNEQTLNNKIKLYPNPSTEFIRILGLTTAENFSIYSILGEEIINGVVSNKEKINVQILTKGLYFLKFENGNVLKFLKK